MVLVNQGKRRTGNIVGLGGAKAFGNAFDQRRLSRAKIAAQQYHVGVPQLRRQLASELNRLLRGVRGEIARHGPNHSIVGRDSSAEYVSGGECFSRWRTAAFCERPPAE